MGLSGRTRYVRLGWSCKKELGNSEELGRVASLREGDSRGIILPRLDGVARLLSGLPGSDGSTEPVRLLLERCFEGDESFAGHSPIEQHLAVELAGRSR